MILKPWMIGSVPANIAGAAQFAQPKGAQARTIVVAAALLNVDEPFSGLWCLRFRLITHPYNLPKSVTRWDQIVKPPSTVGLLRTFCQRILGLPWCERVCLPGAPSVTNAPRLTQLVELALGSMKRFVQRGI
jgi:hypothetical protein